MAWLGDWDTEVLAVRCRVHLRYGGSDQMIPLVHGEWLSGHLDEPERTVYSGDRHLIPMRHWSEMLRSLVNDLDVA